MNCIESGMAPGRECIVGGWAMRRQGGRHIPWVRMGEHNFHHSSKPALQRTFFGQTHRILVGIAASRTAAKF